MIDQKGCWCVTKVNLKSAFIQHVHSSNSCNFGLLFCVKQYLLLESSFFFYHQNSSKKSSTFELQRVQIWNKNSCEKIFRSTFEQFNCHKQNMIDTLLFCFGKNRTFKSSSCQYIAEFLQMHLYNFSFFLFCCCCVNNYIFSAISIKWH